MLGMESREMVAYTLMGRFIRPILQTGKLELREAEYFTHVQYQSLEVCPVLVMGSKILSIYRYDKICLYPLIPQVLGHIKQWDFAVWYPITYLVNLEEGLDFSCQEAAHLKLL